MKDKEPKEKIIYESYYYAAKRQGSDEALGHYHHRWRGHGVGAAVDAAARGYATLLLERGDFGKGTSSRSTKLVHGGVRYLEQGNIALVLEALRERGLLRQNAPHLVSEVPFIVPSYSWWEGPFYGVGLKLYQLMSGKYGFGPSEYLSSKETARRLPNVKTEGLMGAWFTLTASLTIRGCSSNSPRRRRSMAPRFSITPASPPCRRARTKWWTAWHGKTPRPARNTPRQLASWSTQRGRSPIPCESWPSPRRRR